MAEVSEIHEILEQWVAELRSGKYTPCRSYFRKSEKEFDSFGVLLNVIDSAAWRSHAHLSYYFELDDEKSSAIFNPKLEQMLIDLGFENLKYHKDHIFDITEKKPLDQIYELTAQYIEKEIM